MWGPRPPGMTVKATAMADVTGALYSAPSAVLESVPSAQQPQRSKTVPSHTLLVTTAVRAGPQLQGQEGNSLDPPCPVKQSNTTLSLQRVRAQGGNSPEVTQPGSFGSPAPALERQPLAGGGWKT